jgi:23S rRNA (uracil1939-C5)-methyltransferase
MARRNKKDKIFQNISITGIAEKGLAVGRTEEGEVVFVEDAVPGDVVNAIQIKKRKNHSIGRVSEYISYSPERVEPFCKHFHHCGGCRWQNFDYTSQLKHKHIKISNSMHRIGKIDESVEINLPIHGKDLKYYRNKLEYTFCDRRWLTPEEIESKGLIESEPALGYHRPGSFSKILDIQECFLQNDLSNDIRNHLKQFCISRQISFYNPITHEGVMRNIILRNTLLGDWMVTVVFGKDDAKKIKAVMDDLRDNFAFITSLNYVINRKVNDTIFDQEVICHHGKAFMVEQLGEIKYKIGPKSFFQTNSEGAKILFDKVVEYADFQGNENVYDLYTGLGSIALYVANRVKKIVGIEEIPEAIQDAHVNAEYNNIKNASFYDGDVQNIMNELFIEKHGKPDVVITDPPRAGMSEKVINTLLALEAPKIVYVSCNPDTQARDLLLLSDKYDTIKMQPVDMFPHTNHIENVALLTLKKN